jgi:hypothetical protein
MPLDFPSNPVDGQVYGNFYYSSSKGAWRTTTNFNSPSAWKNAIGSTVSATAVPLTIQGYASQSANLQEWKNSAGTTLASVTASGSINSSGSISAGQIIATTPNDSGSTGGVGIKAPAGGSQTSAYLQFVNNAYSSQWGAISANSSGTMAIDSTRLNVPSQTYFPGAIVQAKTMQMNTYTSVYAQDVSAIPGMNMTFAPKFSNSILLLTATVTGTSNYVCTYGFLKDGSNISTLSNSNAYGSVYTSYYNDGQTDGGMRPATFSFSYSPGSTANATYYVGVSSSWAGSIYTTYINDRSSADMRSYSSFTILEIAQ